MTSFAVSTLVTFRVFDCEQKKREGESGIKILDLQRVSEYCSSSA